MPPKVDIKILSGKRDNAKHALNELFDEFETLHSVEPELNLLSTVFKEIESKYRGIKKQIETTADRFVQKMNGLQIIWNLETKLSKDN